MPEPPALNQEEATAFRQGIREFNSGKFFECHDTLEEIWRGIRGPARGFFQGLIQAAVGFYHLGNANTAGSRSQLEKALGKLAPYQEVYLGVDLAALRAVVREWIRIIDSGDPLPADPPKIQGGDAETSMSTSDL